MRIATWGDSGIGLRRGPAARVLTGGRRRGKTLRMESGDLQIFKGRSALLRVTPVEGRMARYVGLYSFVEEPGMAAAPERGTQLYGRSLQLHCLFLDQMIYRSTTQSMI